MSYTLSFCSVLYYIVSEIYIGRRFLEDWFYCYPQQIIYGVAKETLIPSNRIERVPEHIRFNTVTRNATLNQAKQM